MGNVTLEVRGVSVGGGAPSSGGGSAGESMNTSAGRNFLPADERMIADVRREMQSRGVLLVPGSQGLKQIITDYRESLSKQAEKGVSEQFQPRRDALQEKQRSGYAKIERELEAFYREGLTSSSPQERQQAQDALNRDRRVKDRQLQREIQKDKEEIDKEEASAKQEAELRLEEALKRLTETLEREAKANPELPDSYVNRLRSQQKELIAERDSASDEAGAIAASKRLAEVNEKLRRAMTGEDTTQNRAGNGWGVALNTMQGIQQFASASESGNLGGMISGIGGTGVGIATAMGGLSMSAAAALMGGVALLAALGAGIQRGGQTYDEISQLGAFRATVGGRQGLDAGRAVEPMVLNSSLMGSDYYRINRLGLSDKEFVKEAEQRIRARGTSEDWYNEVYRQIALERSLALRKGALVNAGAYDRYGIDSTEAITRLVSMLSAIQGSGVSVGDFTRVQEKLDIQQQIMGSYMGRADRPNYDYANRAVGAMSAVRGVTQDTRIGSDYATMQNALQNPMNDRMKALVYGTIEDIMPSTRGRMDLIDQALRDPKNEGKILQAVIQRISGMYGGMDTQMGYFAFRNIFPGIAPDRLKDYINDFSNPNTLASKILTGAQRGPEGEADYVRPSSPEAVKNILAKQGTEYTSAVTSSLKIISNFVGNIWTKMAGGADNSVQGNNSSNGVRGASGDGNS